MPPPSPFNADSRPLPSGWKECFDAQQKVYYYQNDLVNPPPRSYGHPSDVLVGKANTSDGMSFAQRLYASARVQQQPNITQATNSAFSGSTNPTASSGYDNIMPQPLVQRQRTPVRFAHIDEGPITESDSTVYTKQSDRLAELQRQSLATSSNDPMPSAPSDSVAGSTVPHDSHGPPPAFSSSNSPPPVGPREPPEWQEHVPNSTHSEADSSGSILHRRPTLPIYSPVAEEGISYSVPDDEMDSLADGIDALNNVTGNSESLWGCGHAEIVSPPLSDPNGSHIHDDPPPAFSDLPNESGSSPPHQPESSVSSRALPTITPTALASAATRMMATERSSSVSGQNMSNRRMLGLRRGPAAPRATSGANCSTVDGIQAPEVPGQAANPPRPMPDLNPRVTPASRLSMNPSPRGIAAPVSGPPTESSAAAYARSLYASAVTNAAHPIQAQQHSSQVVVNQNLSARSNTGSDPDAWVTPDRRHLTATRTLTPSASGVARAQSPSVIAPSPRPITSLAPQTQVQHLQAQATVTVAATALSTSPSTVKTASSALPSPPPLPQRRSAASELASTMRIERLSSEDPQSMVQSQTQGQVHPYRYSTAVVPASPVASTHSSHSGSSSSFSFFGTPASSSNSWADKTKKKTGGLLGVSSQKHKEMKRREEEERRARERAAAARAAAAAEQGTATGVVRRVPPPPPPIKPTTAAEATQTLPANIYSNPYVAVAYAQQVQGQGQAQAAQAPSQAQNIKLQYVQTGPDIPQHQQPENAAMVNVLTGMNTGLAEASRRVQAGVSATLRQAGTVAGNVVNAASNALANNGSAAQQTQRDLDLFGETPGLMDAPLFDQQAGGLDMNDFSDGQGTLDPSLFAEELGAGLLSFTAEGVNALDGFNDTVLGSFPNEGLDVNNLDQVGLSAFDSGAFDAGLDISALTGTIQDGGFDMSSIGDALNFDGDAQDTGLDGIALGAEGVFSTDDPGFVGEKDDSGGYDAMATLDDSQFGGNEDPNALSIGLGINGTYDFAGEVPSDTLDSTEQASDLPGAGGEASAPDELGLGIDNGILHQDSLDAEGYQLDQFDQREGYQIEQCDQNEPDGEYEFGFMQQQASQQDQVEAPQQALEGLQELEQQQQQQQEYSSLQHDFQTEAHQEQQQLQQQLQQQARLEHRLQQQLNQEMRKNRAQAQALQQRLAQERRMQQQQYAKLQAQLRMQAKQQAEHLARLQRQQAELQQKLQYHFTTQGASQPDVVATFMEDLKKLQEEQTQAIMKLTQVQSNAGFGNAAPNHGVGTNSGTGTIGGGSPQAQSGTVAGHGRLKINSPGNARPPRPAVGSNQQSAGTSGRPHAQAKPPVNTGASAARPQHSSAGGVQLHGNAGNAASKKPNYNHGKPVVVGYSSGQAASSSTKPQVQGQPGALNSPASSASPVYNSTDIGAAGGIGNANHSQTSQSAHLKPVARLHVSASAAGQKVQMSPSAANVATHAPSSVVHQTHLPPSTQTRPNAAGPTTTGPQTQAQVSQPSATNHVQVASSLAPTPAQVQVQQAKLLRIQQMQTQIKRLRLRQAQLQHGQGQAGDLNQMQIQIQIQQLQQLLQLELGQTQAMQQPAQSQPGQAYLQVVRRPNLNLTQPNQFQQMQMPPQMQMQVNQNQMQMQQQIQQQQPGTGASFSAGAQQELGRLAARAGVTIGGLVLGSVLAANNNQ